MESLNSTVRKITPENAVAELSKDDVIVQSYVYSDHSQLYWVLKRDVYVQLSTGKEILIPNGYYYDMASVPKWLWSIVRPFNDGLLGTLIHDYMYVNHIGTRKNADDEYLFWNKITNKNKTDNYVRYVIVRLFGWYWWKGFVKKAKNMNK